MRILKLQKRAARIILGVDKKTPSIKLFNTLNWYKESIIKRNTLVFMRSIVNIMFGVFTLLASKEL